MAKALDPTVAGSTPETPPILYRKINKRRKIVNYPTRLILFMCILFVWLGLLSLIAGCSPKRVITYYSPNPTNCDACVSIWIMEESAWHHKNPPAWNTIAPAVHEEDKKILFVLRRLRDGRTISNGEIIETIAILKVYRDSHKPYMHVAHLKYEHQLWINRYNCIIKFLEKQIKGGNNEERD